MSALLALIPTKDKLYLLGVVLLIAAAWYLVHHERAVGAAAVIAADQRTALVAQAKDQSILAAEQAAENKIGVVYEKAVAIPAVADVGLVCKSSGRGSNPASPNNGSKDSSAANEPASGVFDPSGAILTVLRNDDAQINALIDDHDTLIDYINRLRAAAGAHP